MGEKTTFIVKMYYSQTSDSALPLGNDDISVIEFELLVKVEICELLWEAGHGYVTSLWPKDPVFPIEEITSGGWVRVKFRLCRPESDREQTTTTGKPPRQPQEMHASPPVSWFCTVRICELEELG